VVCQIEIYLCFCVVDAKPVTVPAKRLQGYPKTNVLLKARSKAMSESVNVGVIGHEERENSELSDCSLDITCSTVTQSASSPSEPDQETSTSPDLLMTVLTTEETEGNEILSDCSTVSAENSCSTVSVPSSSELEQENSSRQRSCGLKADNPHRRGKMKKKSTVLKDMAMNCDVSYGNADVTACKPTAVSSTDISNKDQIVVSASNRVQNYLASLGLPGICVFVQLVF